MSLLSRRRALMLALNKDTSLLPRAYQQVEFIQSTGTQWINTNKILSSYNFSVNADIIFTSLSGDERDFIGNLGKEKTDSFVVGWYIGGKGFCYKSNTLNATGITIEKDTRYKFNATYNGTKKTITNGIETSEASDSKTISSNPIYVFCRGMISNNKPFIGKMYSLRVIDNGETLLDLIPCYRKADNVAGMFDVVNNKFYTNTGTGTFIVGGDV